MIQQIWGRFQDYIYNKAQVILIVVETFCSQFWGLFWTLCLMKNEEKDNIQIILSKF